MKRPQFSLRDVLLVTSLCAVLLAWAVDRARLKQQGEEAIRRIRKNEGQREENYRREVADKYWELFGDKQPQPKPKNQ